jgi:hypothetical protein
MTAYGLLVLEIVQTMASIDWSIAGIGEGVTYKCSLGIYCVMFTWL